MAGKGRPGPRQPATKLPHLQKKQLKQQLPQTGKVGGARKGSSQRGGESGGDRRG
ncbi:hypothetical protein Mal4_40820 [Maioricimonas rarisocia]|uniref:Uncharacterized protein n=1 Tax=Maioricimonas rarisocia TaxID=2528026 RepID=A0A517ZB56_9PLAN|nr:hypothetical protein [Maioricimonas rarisocia]QDU39735.1 hypothetical protein Mal4_40820 [Maioricimonas rarisocia]